MLPRVCCSREAVICSCCTINLSSTAGECVSASDAVLLDP